MGFEWFLEWLQIVIFIVLLVYRTLRWLLGW